MLVLFKLLYIQKVSGLSLAHVILFYYLVVRTPGQVLVDSWLVLVDSWLVLEVQVLGNSWNSTRKSSIYQDYIRTLPGIPLEEKQPGMNHLVENGSGKDNQDSSRNTWGV
jgi:hypothetical protein